MKHFLLVLLLPVFIVAKAQSPADFVMPIIVTQIPDSAKVRFQWVSTVAAEINIFKRPVNAAGWGNPVAQLGPGIGVFTDTVTIGKTYEYYFKVSRSSAPSYSHSYLAVGIEARPVHYKGKALLLVDSTILNYVPDELKRLKLDLICEGWMVSEIDVERWGPVAPIRNKVIANYNLDTLSHHTLFILGDVTVPYSGELAADGHTEHMGAWPTDLYYADTKGVWTDNTVNNTSGTRTQNHNIPGDGKFDKSYLNGKPQLAAGRVDMAYMNSFGTDSVLYKRYLDKDHDYRTKAFTVRQRVLVDDNLGFGVGYGYAQNGWRNGWALVKPDSTANADYVSAGQANSYLMGYGCGLGNFTSATGIGNSSNFVGGTKIVFNMLFGSYFGEWYTPDNFLRAPLAAPGYGLTNCWAGRGNWFFHIMGMGLPVSHSIINTQFNQDYLPGNLFAGYIQNNFLGDPTLTLNPVYQPTALTLAENTTSGDVDIAWAASADEGILGYYVYRAPALMDSFVCITPQYVNALTYTDTQAPLGNNVYMVRPVKLQTTVTGSYYNVGRGVLDSITVLTIPDGVQENIAANFTVYPNPSNGLYTIKTNGAKATYNLELYNTLGEIVWKQTLTAPITTIVIATQSSGVYYLKIVDENSLQSGFKKLVKY